MLLEILAETKIQDGCLAAIYFQSALKIKLHLWLTGTNKPATFQINSSYAPRDIKQKQNPRWWHSGHICFQFSSKTELDLCHICANKPATFHIKSSNTSQGIEIFSKMLMNLWSFEVIEGQSSNSWNDKKLIISSPGQSLSIPNFVGIPHLLEILCSQTDRQVGRQT